MDKQVFSKEQYLTFIDQWKESNLNKRRFCDAHGLRYSSFLYYIKMKEQQCIPVSGFEPLVVTGDEDRFVTLTGTNGLSLKIAASNTGASFVKSLLLL
jgi:hypothetical protein